MPASNLIGLGGIADAYVGLPPRQDPADALSLGRQALGLAEETGNAGLGEEFLASQWRNGGPDIDPSTLAMLRLLQKQQRAPLTALEGELGAVGGEPTERFGDTLLRLGKTGELEAVGQDFVPDLKTDTTRQYAAYRDAVAQRARTSGVMGRGAGEDFAMAPAAPRDARGQTPGGPVIGIKGVNKNLPKMTPEQEQKILAALQSKQIEREAKRAGLSEDLAEARRLFQSGVRGQGLQGGRLRREQREQTDLARNEERTFAKEADRETRHQQGVMDFWRNKQFEIEQQGTKLFERLRDSGVSEADAQAAVVRALTSNKSALRAALSPKDRAIIMEAYRDVTPASAGIPELTLGTGEDRSGAALDPSGTTAPIPGTVWNRAVRDPNQRPFDPDIGQRQALFGMDMDGPYPNTDPLGLLLNLLEKIKGKL